MAGAAAGGAEDCAQERETGGLTEDQAPAEDRADEREAGGLAGDQAEERGTGGLAGWPSWRRSGGCSDRRRGRSCGRT